MYAFSACRVKTLERFWALKGFRVLTRKGLGLRFEWLNLKHLRFELYGLSLTCLNLKPWAF